MTRNSIASLRPCGKRAARRPPSPASEALLAISGALAARSAPAAASTAAVVATRALLLRRPRRGILRPLDQLLRLDEASVLVLGDELETDPAAGLVDLLDDDVDDVAARHDVLDVRAAAGPDVRDVEQAVRALLQLDEGAELRRLHDLARVGVAHLGLLRQRADRGECVV